MTIWLFLVSVLILSLSSFQTASRRYFYSPLSKKSSPKGGDFLLFVLIHLPLLTVFDVKLLSFDFFLLQSQFCWHFVQPIKDFYFQFPTFTLLIDVIAGCQSQGFIFWRPQARHSEHYIVIVINSTSCLVQKPQTLMCHWFLPCNILVLVEEEHISVHKRERLHKKSEREREGERGKKGSILHLEAEQKASLFLF